MESAVAAAEKIVAEAQRTVQDGACVNAITAATSNNTLRAALRTLLVRCTATDSDRFPRLCDLGLWSALETALWKCLDFSLTRVKLLMFCMGKLAKRTGWRQCALRTRLHAAIAQALALPELLHSARTTAEQLLAELLHFSCTTTKLEAHRAGATAAVLTSEKLHAGLLAELLCSCSAGRYVLRDPERALRCLQKLHLLLKRMHTQSRPMQYTAVVQCMCRLLDNDLVRCSAALQHKQHLVRDTLCHLQEDWSRVDALRLVQSLLGRGDTCFIGQPKESKIPQGEPVDQCVELWTKTFGTEGLAEVVDALNRSSMAYVHMLGSNAIKPLAEYLVLCSAQASAAADCLVRSIILLQLRTPSCALRALYTLLQVLVNGQLMDKSLPVLLSPAVNVYAIEKLVHVPTHDCGDSGTDCPICLCQLTPDTTHRTSCGHRMHGACLRTWLRENRNCPVCRSDGINIVAHIEQQQQQRESAERQSASPPPLDLFTRGLRRALFL